MKNTFKGFYQLDEDEFSQIWEKATFVFDANVLLNLYRYQEDTVKELLKVIEYLKDNGRIWIPYHVALEYQKNRLKVIAEQNIKFEKVEKAIKKGISSIENEFNSLELKKRHSTIDPDNFIKQINSLSETFLTELNAKKERHFSVTSEDSVRQRLDDLFKDKIGGQPEDQEAINSLQKIAKDRFENKVPPGYMDDDKGKTDTPSFTYQGITYQRKFSDYIIWSQIKDFAKNEGLANLIFITDDNKKDWWLKIEQDGEKTISPRPELISEILQETSVEHFHMYNSQGFLKYANEKLDLDVSTNAINELKNIAELRDEKLMRRNEDKRREHSKYHMDNSDFMFPIFSSKRMKNIDELLGIKLSDELNIGSIESINFKIDDEILNLNKDILCNYLDDDFCRMCSLKIGLLQSKKKQFEERLQIYLDSQADFHFNHG